LGTSIINNLDAKILTRGVIVRAKNKASKKYSR